MYNVYFAPDAAADLEQIALYIATDGPRRALAFIDELQTRVGAMLSVHPRSGAIYKGETRYLTVGRYVVLYEIDEARGAVNILHITGAGADWKQS